MSRELLQAAEYHIFMYVLQAASDEDDELAVSQKGVPQGFEAISLIEALNGPCYYSNKPTDPKQRLTSSHSKSLSEYMCPLSILLLGFNSLNISH